jgi:hypothetical protein
MTWNERIGTRCFRNTRAMRFELIDKCDRPPRIVARNPVSDSDEIGARLVGQDDLH